MKLWNSQSSNHYRNTQTPVTYLGRHVAMALPWKVRKHFLTRYTVKNGISNLYILLKSVLKCRKWRFRDPNLKIIPEGMPPDPPTIVSLRTPWNHEWWNQSLLCLMIFCRYITNILSVHLLQFYSAPPTFKCLATLLFGRRYDKKKLAVSLHGGNRDHSQPMTTALLIALSVSHRFRGLLAAGSALCYKA